MCSGPYEIRLFAAKLFQTGEAFIGGAASDLDSHQKMRLSNTVRSVAVKRANISLDHGKAVFLS